MIDFIQATKEDVLSIYPQLPQDDPDTIALGRATFEKDVIPLEGLAVAILDCGRCLGAYGLIKMWPGVARVWALFSEDVIVHHPVLLGLHVKRDIERGVRLGFRRIEATTSVKHEVGAEFLLWLGFAREGLMRCYSPSGEDMYLYAKVEDVI